MKWPACRRRAVIANDDKPRLLQLAAGPWTRRARVRRAERFGDGEGACGQRSSRVSPAGRRSRCACRRGAPSRVRTASSRRHGAARAACPLTRPSARPCARRRPASEEIALTGVHLGSYGRDLAPPASLVRLLLALATAACREGPAAGVRFRISSLEPMDCTSRDRRARCRARLLRTAFSPAAAARERSRAGSDAPAVWSSAVRGPGQRHQDQAAPGGHRFGCHCRVSGRDRRGLRGARVVPRRVSPDARSRVSLLRPARHGRHGNGRQGAGRSRPRARPARPRYLRPAWRSASEPGRSARSIGR